MLTFQSVPNLDYKDVRIQGRKTSGTYELRGHLEGVAAGQGQIVRETALRTQVRVG